MRLRPLPHLLSRPQGHRLAGRHVARPVASPVGVLAIALAIALVAIGWVRPVAAAVLPCSVTWTGGAGTDRWFEGANWSSGVVPAPTDVVCAPGGTDEVLVLDTVATASVAAVDTGRRIEVRRGGLDLDLESKVGELDVVGGTVTVDGPLELGRFEQLGGTVTGPGTIDVAGDLVWTNGTQSGTGTTQVGAGTHVGALIMDGDGDRILAGRTLLSVHATRWEATTPLTLARATLVITDLKSTTHAIDIAGSGSVIVGGTLLATTSVRIGPSLLVTETGSLEVVGPGNVLELRGPGSTLAGPVGVSDSAALHVAAGAVTIAPTSSLEAGSTSPVTVAGSVVARGPIEVGGLTTIDGGAIEVLGGATFGPIELRSGRLDVGSATTATDLRQLDGEVDGAADLTLTGNLDWSAGTQRGTGRTEAAGALLLPGAFERTVVDRQLATNGLVWKQEGTLHLDGGAHLALAGTSLVEGERPTIEGTGTIELSGALTAKGTGLLVDARFGTTAAAALHVIERSDVFLNRGGRHEGTIDIAEASTVLLNGDTELAAASTVRGSGAIDTYPSAITTIAGTVAVDDLTLSGTTAVVAGAEVGAVTAENQGYLGIEEGAVLATTGSFVQTAGATVLAGPGSRLVTGPTPIVLQGGALAGSGTVEGSVTSAGELRPGNTGVDDDDHRTGTLHIAGQYEQQPAGRLLVDVGDAGHDRLQVDGGATVAGDLDVTVVGDVAPGTRYEVLKAAALHGVFAPASNPFCSSIEYHDLDSVSVVPQPCLAAQATSATEDGGVALVRFVLGVPTNEPVTFDYATEAISATEGADYEASSGTLTIAAGITVAEVGIPIVDDDDEEGTESFAVQLSDATGAEIRPDEALVVIVDDDGADGDYLVRPIDRFSSFTEAQPKALNDTSVVGFQWLEGYTGIGFGQRLDDGYGAVIPSLREVWDINSSNVMVGTTDSAHGAATAAYRVDGETTPMVGLEARSGSSARGVNDAGVIVGDAATGGAGTAHRSAVVWFGRDQDPTAVEPAGAGDSTAFDINDDGWVVGVSDQGGHQRGWVWKDGATTWIPEIDGGEIKAELAINDEGTVVGGSGDRAFRWTIGGELVDLGPGEAVDINDDGDIVGFDGSADGNGAVLWRDGEKTDLNTRIADGWKLSIAEAINDDGWIAGRGIEADGTMTAFVLEPDGCAVCVELEAEEEQFPTHDWAPIADHTVDGNQVRLRATVTNEELEPVTGSVRFIDVGSGEVIGAPDPATVTLQPGQEGTVWADWDSSGAAWSNGGPAAPSELRAEFVESGAERRSGRGDLAVKVIPRPVVLVHGLWSDASTWSSYQAFLTAQHPDWKAFAVDTMDTASLFPNTIAENAGELATFTERVQVQENAWRVDLVGHSMGGLISRSYIQTSMPSRDGIPAVAHLVMIGTPNGGSPCAWLAPVPATVELRPGIAETFNSEVFDLKHVEVSLAYGNDRTFTCQQPLTPGDSVVPVTSALALPYVTDTQEFALAHTDMTGSEAIFDEFVSPRLRAEPGEGPLAPLPGAPSSPSGNSPSASSSPAGAAGATVAAEPSPQLAFTETASLDPGGEHSSTAVVPEASRVGALVLAPGSVAVDLVGPNGLVAASLPADPGDTTTTFRTVAVDSPAPGQWTVQLRRGADDGEDRAIDVPLSMWLDGTATHLSVHGAVVDRDGRVRIIGQVTGLIPQHRPEQLAATVIDRDGGETSATLLDDGAHDDGTAGDGFYAATVGPLAEGAYSVVLLADAPHLARMTATAVLVRRGDGTPGNDAPVALDATVTTGYDMNTQIQLEATDVDGDPLTYRVVDAPIHGRLGGMAPLMTYTPEAGFRGRDTFTFAASDGLATSAPATVTIEVGAVPTVLDLVAPLPAEGRVSSTVDIRVRLTDARSATVGGAALTVTLDGATVDAVTGSNGEAIGSLPIAADAVTGERELVVTYTGDVDHRGNVLRRTFTVLPNRAPEVFPVGAPFAGEAGYPVRLSAVAGDDDGNATTIEWDVDDDGTWDLSVPLTGREVGPVGIDHTYASSYEGQVRARVTDAGGLQAETVAPITVVEHRPLGRTERLVHAGEWNRGDRVESGAISGDGRFVLHTVPDDVVDPADPIPHLSALFLLDRSTGRSVEVSVRPDGTPATGPTGLDPERAAVSGDGRFVAFTAGDPMASQVYVRDVATGSTELVSGVGSSAATPASGPSSAVGLSADGQAVLLRTWAPDIDPDAPCPLASDGSTHPCERLVVHDRSSGTSAVVGQLPGGGVAPLASSAGAAAISADGRHVVFATSGTRADRSGSLDRIIAVDRSTGRAVEVVGEGAGPTSLVTTHPSVSADGRLVAFA
jgi:hypothetical protein